MADILTQKLDSCAEKMRADACPGCHLISEVSAVIDSAVEQLRWEFNDDGGILVV